MLAFAECSGENLAYILAQLMCDADLLNTLLLSQRSRFRWAEQQHSTLGSAPEIAAYYSAHNLVFGGNRFEIQGLYFMSEKKSIQRVYI